jgi:hypothetical protein
MQVLITCFMHMSKKRIKPFRPVYPSPAGLVTSISEDGQPNVITLGEIFNKQQSTAYIHEKYTISEKYQNLVV